LKKIIITGATGFIGARLTKSLIERGDEVTVFTRSMEKINSIPGVKEYVKWDYRNPAEWERYIERKGAVIHLAGANLFGRRWNDNYKKLIVDSREVSTLNLAKAIKKIEKKPEVFICASAVGYYGNSENNLLTENSPAGNDFLATVCKRWEAAAAEVEKAGVRRISIRTGLVLSTEEGTLKKMLLPFKLFIGGSLGNGKQWFPWIHIDDLINIFLFTLDNNNVNGTLNASSPNPVRMKEFTKTLGKVLRRPSFFTVPEFVLKIVLGEFADAVVASFRVVPEKLIDNNFQFEFVELESALRDLLKE
jgi:uncharacterized protein (TIGR01777 family)